MRKLTLVVLIIGVMMLGGVLFQYVNTPLIKDQLEVSGLKSDTRIVRDEKGMPYLFAANLHDAFIAQGFATAEDRIFQMFITRLLIQGRLSEVFGEAALETDKLMRTLGMRRAAKKHWSLLGEKERGIFNAYAAGVNHFIDERSDDLPIELKLAGIPVSHWSPIDSLAILYFMAWQSSANLQSEILSQALLDKVGPKRYASLEPLHRPVVKAENIQSKSKSISRAAYRQGSWSELSALFDRIPTMQHGVGSNNWALSGDITASGKPLLSNDPHLKTGLLASYLYPLGIFAGEVEVVGAVIPGIPSVLVGRNRQVATGITNAYADVQDLYLEVLDPSDANRYLEGTTSKPFEKISETIRIKEDGGFREEELVVRLTDRGPVVSDLLPGLDAKRPVTVRWSALERMKGEIGLDYLLHAKSVEDLEQRLTKLDVISLNYVMADTQGNIGWRVTGAIPIRSADIGKVPWTVREQKDTWSGWISDDEMPHLAATKSGWIGTANHNITPKHYPYYLSNWFAPPNRIRRMKALINSSRQQTSEQSWQYMRDTLNVTAQRLTPFIISALSSSSELKPVAAILEKWDFHDDASLVAPTVYHQIYQALFREIFTDDLGEELVDLMLQYPYFWNERLEQVMFEKGNDWLDDKTTKELVETTDMIIRRAAGKAVASLSKALGDDMSQWRWGDVHTIEFLNPIRRSGIGKGLLGGGKYAMSGSGDTLYRAAYSLNHVGIQKPVTYSAAARMVFDLSDDKKVLGVIPGGQSGRTFSSHYTDQVSSYMDGEKRYWWFDEALILEHRQSELVLHPDHNE